MMFHDKPKDGSFSMLRLVIRACLYPEVGCENRYSPYLERMVATIICSMMRNWIAHWITGLAIRDSACWSGRAKNRRTK